MPKEDKKVPQGIQLFRLFLTAYPNGYTTKEACDALGISVKSGSSRISQLVRANCLMESMISREGGGHRHVVYEVDPKATEDRYTRYMSVELKGRSPKNLGSQDSPDGDWGARVLDLARSTKKDPSVRNIIALLNEVLN